MPSPEVSIVMPCLNEEASIGVCIEKARTACERDGIDAEIVVSDNGSTDKSVEIAQSLGARVVYQPEKGYGYAYMKGFAEARGKYIVMGDSDNTYDFLEIERFLEPLRNGYDLVMGSRFKGRILPGAMPWSHQYIGNPVLTGILKLFFRRGISDAHCGMRAFTKEAYERMHLQTTGMEFASEMVINASRAGLRVTEVPITYYPRAEGAESKLHSLRDGWRHLRFMLLYSPNWLFMIPGLALFGLGFVMLFALVGGPLDIGGLRFDMHYMVLGSLLTLMGFQVITLGAYAKMYAISEHFEEKSRTLNLISRYFNLERGILMGSLVFVAGLGINLYILLVCLTAGFQGQPRLREAILAMTLMVIGLQTVFSSFFLSMLVIKRR
jgi:glycosyltransferase involved in cell wall biosynthesis